MHRVVNPLITAVWFIAASGLVSLVLVSKVRAEDELARRIDESVRPKIESKDFVGVVVGVVEGEGRPPRVMGFGTTTVGTKNQPDGDTLFEIGSVTKVFTAITLAELVEEGHVRLGDPVESLLPKGTRVPAFEGKKITLEQLATHTSALPRITSVVMARALTGKDPYAEVDEKSIYDSLSKLELKRAIGEKYEYSNLGAGLLGMAMANREGIRFEQLVEQKILKPLKLNDTHFKLDSLQNKRLASPYLKGGSPAKNWNFAALAGCGGLKSSANDMLRFLSANLECSRGDDPLDRAMRASHEARHDATGSRIRIALGWHVTTAKTDMSEVIWHSGGTGGYRSFIGFQPKTRRAVVVLGNTDASVDGVAMNVFRLMDEKSAQHATENSAKKQEKSHESCIRSS